VNFFNLTYVVAIIVSILDAVTCQAEPESSPPDEAIPLEAAAADGAPPATETMEATEATSVAEATEVAGDGGDIFPRSAGGRGRGFVPAFEVGPGRAFETLGEVASLLEPGDVVLVQGDHTYPGDVVFENAGTEAAKITILGVQVRGERPRIEGGVSTLAIRADHYVVEGFDVTGGSSCCVEHQGDDVTLRDTLIHDCPAHEVLGGDGAGSLILEDVEVRGSRGESRAARSPR
jgi:hypothetical protein